MYYIFVLVEFFSLVYFVFIMIICRSEFNLYLIYNVLNFCLGMVYSREEIHGRMGYMAPIVPFHQDKTSLTFFKLRIRLAVIFTSLPLPSTRLLEGSVASKSQAVH